MINLFVSSFGYDIDWIKDAKRIEVGCFCRNICKDENIYYDDENINISDQNSYFGELTGLFWIWKNLDFNKDDIIGFCHYNKCLDISKKKIDRFFLNNGLNAWVVRTPECIVKHTFTEDIQDLCDILKEYYPEYYKSWLIFYNEDGSSRDGKRNCFCAEVFYARYYEFSQYCEFLFDVLFKLREKVGDVNRHPYYKRYCALLGERLLSIYIHKNKCPYLSVNIKYNESRVSRFLRRLAYALKINRNSTIFKVGKKIFGRKQKSSYIS